MTMRASTQTEGPITRPGTEPLPRPAARTGPPPYVVVVSDLHLATGRDPVTGRFDRRENFFADDAFRRFLESHPPAAEGRPAPVLVLNGDIFDFLRVVHVPSTDAECKAWSEALAALGRPMTPDTLAASIAIKERRFGLRTDDYKTVWKLHRIARGHGGFFAALGWWVRERGEVVFVKGNHDVELHWPLVQQAIRNEIGPPPGTDPEQRVRFVEEYERIGNVHIEHGHRFESVTRVPAGGPVLPNGREIRLPLGSFVNRYIVNKLEYIEPFLDNIKPVQDLLWTVIRRHPLSVLRVAWHGIPFVRRALRPYFFKDALGFQVFLFTLLIPALTLILVALVLFVPPVRDFVTGVIQSTWLRRGLSVAGTLAPWILAFGRELLPKRKPTVGEDHYAEGLYHTMRKWNRASERVYGVAGHTHRMDVQALGKTDESEVFYVNSGSWAPVWVKDRPDLAGHVKYTFVLFTRGARGEYRHECMEWIDDRGMKGEAVPAALTP
jgi:UDP-2,3-diacylglucosamine pyrophosphatase LpxH